MREEAPKLKAEVIDLQEGPDGEWRMLKEKASAEAKDLITAIIGYESMSLEDRASTLDDVIEGLSSNNKNRFVAKELAKEVKAIELMKSIEENSAELGRLGRNVDVRV